MEMEVEFANNFCIRRRDIGKILGNAVSSTSTNFPTSIRILTHFAPWLRLLDMKIYNLSWLECPTTVI